MGVYTPTTWAGGPSGTEITTTRLQNIESGVSNAHTEINSLSSQVGTKISTPAGGADGNVLAKSASVAVWVDPTVLSVDLVTGDTTLGNSNKDLVEVNSSSPVTITLPIGVTAGRTFEVYQAGTGQVTVAGDTGVTVRTAPPATGLKTAGQFGSVHVRCRQSAAAPNPPSSNLAYRLLADSLSGTNGSAVSSWADSSAAALPAAVQATGGNQPTLNTNSGGTGHKGVSFNGSSSFLTLSGAALDLARNKGALTIFAALVFPSAVTTGTRTFFALSTGASATSARVLMGQRESVGGLPIAGGRRLDGNTLASVTGTAIGTIQNTILTSRFLWSSSDLYLYQNGTQVGSSTSFQTDGSTDNTASLAGVIGANLAGTGEWFQGHILELLLYNDSDTSGALRQSVHSYFQQTYGIASTDALAAGEWVVSGGVA